MLISAFRSLGREFSGIVVRKNSSQGVTSTQYWLFLIPESEIETRSGSEAIINALIDDPQSNLSDTDLLYQRVGVSSVVYTEAQNLTKVEKNAFSPFISVQSRTFIDLGINWFIFGLAGILLSVWMYLQTLKRPPPSGKYEPEEIELPGF
ncbi:MAG: hypothetical protein PWR01_4438 [Clostridiales bacterium]|nr:hypothetical protein [Clostridiales bacterium]MDN5283365.1 hypothetical protein [Candidatus Ozemobacter sp.]